MGEHWLQGPLAGKAAAPGSLPWGHGVLCARPWVPWAAEFRGSSHLDWNPAAGEAAQGSCRNKLGKEDTPILHGVGRSGALGAQVFLFWFWPLGVPASSSGSPSCQASHCPGEQWGAASTGLGAQGRPFLSAWGGWPGGRCDSVEHLCCILLVLDRTQCLHRLSPWASEPD